MTKLAIDDRENCSLTATQVSSSLPSAVGERYMEVGGITKVSRAEAKACANDLYRRVAERWQERVTNQPFMQKLCSGTLSRDALRLFFKNWASFTIDINTLECATYHKHVAFFRKHRDLMAAMAQKLADELIYPKPPGHIHVVLETAKALGISEDEVFLEPMPAEFRSLIDFRRALLWEGTMAEVYAAGATEEQIGYWSAQCFKALTTRYGLTPDEAAYFSTHEEADLKEHQGGVMGHGTFRRIVLERLLEDGAELRPGYSLEYCAMTSVDLYGATFQATLEIADRKTA
jgi:pyrroloquinoline quinone (PQQ) biosynthesis protein C